MARTGGIVGLAILICVGEAQAQTMLPEIVVTSPSPIRRAAKPAPTPRPAPVQTVQAPEPQTQPEPLAVLTVTPLPGALPIVTDQFATVTVVPGEELRRAPVSTLGDLL